MLLSIIIMFRVFIITIITVNIHMNWTSMQHHFNVLHCCNMPRILMGRRCDAAIKPSPT